MKRFGFSLRIVLEVIVALAMGFVGYDYFTPASTYFSATLSIPDHATGEQPNVVYIRTINSTIAQDWHTETRPYPEKQISRQYCRGDGSNLYEKGETKQLLMTLAEYSGVEKCELPPGTYRTYTCWTHKPYIFKKKVCIKSPPYTVHPK